MSIFAKQALVNEIGEDLVTVLTTEQLLKVREVVELRLSNYDVETAHERTCGAEYIEAFLAAKQIEGRSETTVKHYRLVLTNLCKETGVTVPAMTVNTLRGYLAELKGKGVSDRTLEGYRSVFSSFFGWLQKEGLLQHNPCANLGVIKYKKEVRYPLSATDMEKLRDVCDNTRNKALLSFLLATGCRVSEAVSVNRNDIDLRNRECKVLGKGNKERVVYLDDIAALWIERYLDSRTDNLAPLFISSQKTRMCTSTVRQMLHTLEHKAGIEDVHPHRFRRTLATNLLNRGMSIQEVAAILGHENINTTMTYVYLDQMTVKTNYLKYAQ